MRGFNPSARCSTSFAAVALLISFSSACGSGSDNGGSSPTAGSPSSSAGSGASGVSGGLAGGTSGGSAPTAGGNNTAGSANGGNDSSAGAGGAGTAGSATGGNGTAGSGTAGGATTGGSGVGGTRLPGANGYNCTPPSGTLPVLTAKSIVSTGLSQPILVTHTPNGSPDRLFVVERSGKIRIVDKGALVTKPFLDITSKVVAGTMNGDERGFLGLAFHPNYAQNGLFYVNYSDRADANDTGDTIIEEYKVSSSSPDEADPASARLVLKVEQPTNSNAAFRNHKGGSINFGPDGFLYIGLGDGGGSGDTDTTHGTGNGQSLSALLGKILRIDPVKGPSAAYTSPPGNLKDKMSGAAPEIWDYGLRNPFRTNFDGCTGDLYIGDVGQDKYEELDIEKVGEGNKNYGWNEMEGKHCYQPMTSCDQTGITLPLVEYDHTTGKSISGGAVYRGSAIPALRGTYFYADYTSNAIWSLVYDRDKGTVSAPVSLKQDINNVTSIVAIQTGADGEIYFVSLTGGLFRIEAAP